VELPVDNIPDESNLQVDVPQPETQPESPAISTRNYDGPNPKLGETFETLLARIEHRKDVKEVKERKEGATRKFIEPWLDKPERQSPFWCEAHGFCHSERFPDHRADQSSPKLPLLQCGMNSTLCLLH
jgi:hypothetical protein